MTGLAALVRKIRAARKAGDLDSCFAGLRELRERLANLESEVRAAAGLPLVSRQEAEE